MRPAGSRIAFGSNPAIMPLASRHLGREMASTIVNQQPAPAIMHESWGEPPALSANYRRHLPTVRSLDALPGAVWKPLASSTECVPHSSSVPEWMTPLRGHPVFSWCPPTALSVQHSTLCPRHRRCLPGERPDWVCRSAMAARPPQCGPDAAAHRHGSAVRWAGGGSSRPGVSMAPAWPKRPWPNAAQQRHGTAASPHVPLGGRKQ